MAVYSEELFKTLREQYYRPKIEELTTRQLLIEVLNNQKEILSLLKNNKKGRAMTISVGGPDWIYFNGQTIKVNFDREVPSKLVPMEVEPTHKVLSRLKIIEDKLDLLIEKLINKPDVDY